MTGPRAVNELGGPVIPGMSRTVIQHNILTRISANLVFVCFVVWYSDNDTCL